MLFLEKQEFIVTVQIICNDFYSTFLKVIFSYSILLIKPIILKINLNFIK